MNRGKPKSRSHILSIEDIGALCSHVREPIDKVILICCLFSGMRVGEVAHMRNSWWNGSAITIPPKQPCSCYECNLEGRDKKGKKGFWYPKTDRAERIIPVRDKYQPILDRFFSYNKAVGITRIRIYQRMKELTRKAGVRSNVFPHAMRATYITDLIERSVDLWVVKEVVGHASIRTTEQYVKLRPQAVKRELEKKAWK